MKEACKYCPLIRTCRHKHVQAKKKPPCWESMCHVGPVWGFRTAMILIYNVLSDNSHPHESKSMWNYVSSICASMSMRRQYICTTVPRVMCLHIDDSTAEYAKKARAHNACVCLPWMSSSTSHSLYVHGMTLLKV